MYLKCLDNLQGWDLHTRTRKILSVQPPHSPDLNVSDSYLWGHLKPLGYSDPIAKEETLQQRILLHVKPFPTAQEIFEIMRQSIIRRVHACIDSSGGKFEHPLWTVTWRAISTAQLLNWKVVLQIYYISCQYNIPLLLLLLMELKTTHLRTRFYQIFSLFFCE